MLTTLHAEAKLNAQARMEQAEAKLADAERSVRVAGASARDREARYHDDRRRDDFALKALGESIEREKALKTLVNKLFSALSVSNDVIGETKYQLPLLEEQLFRSQRSREDDVRVMLAAVEEEKACVQATCSALESEMCAKDRELHAVTSEARRLQDALEASYVALHAAEQAAAAANQELAIERRGRSQLEEIWSREPVKPSHAGQDASCKHGGDKASIALALDDLASSLEYITK
jgi:hypothetical protein